jgi:hypothetical protein
MNKLKSKDEKKTSAENSSRNSLDKTLSAMSAGFQPKLVRRSQFMTSVVSIAEDHSSAKVKLCTGAVIDVPTSILKNVTYLGTVTNDNECLGLASAEIDVSTEVGMLIHKMAQELDHVSRRLQVTQEGLARLQGAGTAKSEEVAATGPRPRIRPSDNVLPAIAVKIPFQGIAGNPYAPSFIFYQAPAYQYIQDWEVIGTVNCYFRFPPVVGGIDGQGRAIGLQFFPDAAHGTPLGTHYDATVIVYVTLVQETT